MSNDDYRWYVQALEALWIAGILTDGQHDRALVKLERMLSNDDYRRYVQAPEALWIAEED